MCAAGGKRGFDKVIWGGGMVAHPDGEAVRLTYTSRSGEEVRQAQEAQLF